MGKYSKLLLCCNSVQIPQSLEITNAKISLRKVPFKVISCLGSRGSYALEFKGYINGKSIIGPSVNLTLLPDPNKPVRLSVDFDKNAKFFAGGKFPVFSVTVFSEEGSPMTAFKPADLSILLWEGPPSMRPTAATELKYKNPVEIERKDCYEFREEEIPTCVGEYTVEFSLQTNKKEDHLSHQTEDSKKCLDQKKSEVERIEKMPRRIFSIHKKFSGPDVLGMVGELAFVADEDVARVISWHLQGDMDCVITTMTTAAQKIYDDTQGNQQVMALDSILVQQEDRPLPHIQNCQELFKPSGNPTFARKHLIYRDKQLSCDRNNLIKVFKNLLGDTIVMDDLYSATNYRKALVDRHIQCPTILTRKGERVSNRGKFGGAQNRAPSIDKLKVFGAPLPDSYEELKKQIDVLHQYCAAVEEIEKAKKDLNHYCPKWVDEMQNEKTQMDVITKELEEINKQLASVPVRAGKRASGNSEEPPGTASKRQRRRSMDQPGSFSEMN